MRRLWVILMLISAPGCVGGDFMADSPPQGRPDTPVAREQPRLPEPPPKPKPPHLRPKANTAPIVESYVVCSFDTLILPRSQVHEIDQVFAYTEAGGVFGPDEKVLALNGLRIARLDMRFREPFAKALDVLRAGSRRMVYVRLPEGKAQQFELGEGFKDVSLFVWTSPDAVLGRHFAQARYVLTMRLEKVSPEGLVEYGLSWQANTGASFQRAVTIPSLDLHVEIEKGQSLLIAPTGVAGRSVDRALLSGLDEATVQVTCVVITPMEVRAKPAPKEKPAEPSEGSAREEKTAP